MSSAICFNLDQSKILSSGNVLTLDIFFKNGQAKNTVKKILLKINGHTFSAFKSAQNNKILDLSKLKKFTDE